MAGKRKASKDNSAAIAGQFGVSLKALRLYERIGMLTPPRNAAGWRVYGEAEIARLHAILSFKQLGLPLARIAELLKAGHTDLDALLSVQEQMLEETRREAEHALSLVKVARVRLRDQGDVPPEQLAALVRRISRTLIRRSPELDALAQRSYTPEQRAKFRDGDQSPEELARISEGWERLYADLDALLPDGDPLSEKGLALARRMVALIREQTRGDKDLWNSAYRFWKGAVDDPTLSAQVPMSKPAWDFMAKAFEELKRRGELKP